MNHTSCSNCDHCGDFMKKTLRRQKVRRMTMTLFAASLTRPIKGS